MTDSPPSTNAGSVDPDEDEMSGPVLGGYSLGYRDGRRSRNAEIASLQAQLQRLSTAARAWDATLSEYCDGPERDEVRDALNAQEKP